MDSNVYPFAEVEAKWQRLWEEGRESAQPAGSCAEPPLPGPEAPAVALRHVIYTFPEPFGSPPASRPRPGSGAGLLLVGAPAGAGSPAPERTAVAEALVEESTELAAARIRVCADTLARYERHRGRSPRVALPADGFALGVLAGSLAAGTPPEAVQIKRLEKVARIERSLGMESSQRLVTSDPRLYRFTQWLFLQLLAKKLAYRAERICSACSRCGGRYRRGLEGPCPRCRGSVVEQQAGEWRLDVSPYGEPLIADLERGDWTTAERALERGILGRRRGSEVTFPVSKPFEIEYEELTIFTTRIETIFGVTFILLDPYHPLLDRIVDTAYEDEVARYRERLKKGGEPEISAVRTGGFALNPANLRRIPILASRLANDPWGGGARMGVPAHDTTLFELAKRMKLPIREVIHGEGAKLDSQARLEEAWLGDGVLTNSGPFTSLPLKTGRERIISLLSRKSACRRATRYRLRSVALSSPSPWGPPVPVIRCKRCGVLPVAEGELPVELPPLPPETLAKGDGALSSLKAFIRVRCPQCGEGAEREAETLVPWLGSAISVLAALVPELAGRAAGFRDLSLAAGEDRPAVTPGTAPAGSAASSQAVDLAGVASPAAEGSVPVGHAGVGASLPRDEGRNLLPEDVDIFEVPPAEEPRAGDGEDTGDSIQEEPSGPPDLPPPEPDPGQEPELAPAEEADAGSGELKEPEAPGGVVEAPRAEGREGRRGRDRRRRGRGEGEGRRPASAGEPAAEDEEAKSARAARRGGEEPETIVPELAEDDTGEADTPFKLSALRPFTGAGGPLAPVDTALGTNHLGAKERIGLRLIIKFLEDTGCLPFSEPFLRYRSVEKVLTATEEAPRFPGPRPGDPARPGGPPTPAPRIPAAAEPGAGAPGEGLASVTGLIARYGADALRLQMLFGGPTGRPLVIRAADVRHRRRLLDRIWRQMMLRIERGKFVSRRMLVEKHGLIDKVTRRLAAAKFHTAVASIMSFVSFLEDPETAPEDMDREAMKVFLILLSPFAPHLAAELWARMGAGEALESAPWPVASEELIHPPERDFPILVDGKIRDRMQQPANLESEKLESRALQREKIREVVGSRRVDKVIVVPGKLVSVVLAAER